jgi:hypothetical protein
MSLTGGFSMIATESILVSLGSRFALNFRPNRGDIRVSALGRFLDYTADLAIGVRTEGGVERALPFTRGAAHFEYVEQELTMNSITFRARSVAAGCLMEVTFISPFYPRDVELCTAPFFYVDVRISPIRDMVHWDRVAGDSLAKGTFFLRVARGPMECRHDESGLTWTYRVPLEGDRGVERSYEPPEDESGRTAECTERIVLVGGEGEAGPEGFECPFDATAGPVELRFVWAAHVSDPVLEAGGEPTVFKYNEFLPDIGAVVAFSRDEEERLRRRSGLFDSLLVESSLAKGHQGFIAYTFQSYLSNTWWTRKPDGSDWFSVWEGICMYNSTIDVEYNLGLIYFALWPELLELTFQEWEAHEQPAEVGSFLSHDMGEGCVANGQSYPHHMEVEENTNFLLMLHAHWRWTGSEAAIERHLPLVKRLIAYLEAADKTGNGFANIGTANTIDDASPAVQYSNEQTYLGVKCLCAFHVTADLVDHLGETDLAARCRKRAELIRKTLDAEAWLDDHYVVCIDKDAAAVKDAWTGEELGPGELPGWDAYSLYTSNGMLYPLMVGADLPLEIDRIRQDMINAAWASLIEYGCTHSSADRSNIWISQNLWRDLTGAYLGIDYLDMTTRYWDFLKFENARPEGRCFIDTYIANNLCYYPRGITSIGVLMAGLGMRLDRVAGKLRLAPVRVPLRLPLTALADWENEEIPWVACGIEKGRVICQMQGELPEDVGLDMPPA